MTVVYYWKEDYSEITGYAHNQEYNEDLWSIAKKIYNQGLNIMVKHGKTNDILFVSKSGFKQS